MATFTFGAGNARKLLRLPLYGLGAIAALLVPRSGRRWAFGSGVGLGEGALPLYHAARERLGDGTRLVWLASTDSELTAARAAGLDAEAKHSVRGWWTTLRSRVLVVTHGFGDVNRYATSGGFTVQLWHGIPLKKLHLDTPAALRVRFLPDHRVVRAVMARGHRLASRGIGIFPASSELVAPRIASAFGIPLSRVVVTGDPRDDVLYAGTPDRRRAAGRALIADAVGPLDDEDRLVLYAPTWRDGAADPGAPTLEEWDAIAAWLEGSRSVLLVRTHPLGLGDYAAGTARSTRVRMLGPDRVADITGVLPAIDVLVTDYSSIAYDFSLTESPILFFAPDVEQYARRRGLYESYRTFSGGRYVTTWANVLEGLDAVAAGSAFGAELAAHTRWLRDEHFDLIEGGATIRVLDRILDHVSPEISIKRGAETPEDSTSEQKTPEKRIRAEVLAVGFEVEPPGLQVMLRPDAARGVDGVRFDGARAQADGVVETEADTLNARFPLLTTRWGSAGLALPSGDYRLTLDGAIPTSRLAVSAALPEMLRTPLFHASVHAEGGGLVLRIRPPLGQDELGPAAQKQLEREYRRSRPVPERAVFLESFYGQSASCNPLGIDRALQALRPDVTRYWSVVDGSVAIPEGGIRIIEGSRDWWRVRASARVLVVNDWLRKRYRRREHQHVLQTWHGTMLKRLALDRTDRGLRSRIAIRREDRRWDALLAQNSYSAQIFRSAYAHHGPIWEEGYPRNDEFDRPGRAAEIRAVLGIPDGIRIVLYAPTWRDDRTEMVDYVDLTSFVGELGDDHVLLVRGHSRTLRYGRDLQADGLIDVTSYPDMADLLLIADVLVTDYSSVMFDFTGTGRPMVFFTPDLAHYSEDLRGFYFDLLAEAPGPVARTRDELRDAILDAEAGRPGYASRAAAWRERFTPLDDGASGARVVARLESNGWI